MKTKPLTSLMIGNFVVGFGFGIGVEVARRLMNKAEKKIREVRESN